MDELIKRLEALRSDLEKVGTWPAKKAAAKCQAAAEILKTESAPANVVPIPKPK